MSRLGPRRVAAPRGLRSAQLTNAQSFGNIDRGRARGRSPPPLDTAAPWRADPSGRVRTVVTSSHHSPPTRRPVADPPLLPPRCELAPGWSTSVVGAGQCPAGAYPSRSRPAALLYSRAVRVG